MSDEDLKNEIKEAFGEGTEAVISEVNGEKIIEIRGVGEDVTSVFEQ